MKGKDVSGIVEESGDVFHVSSAEEPSDVIQAWEELYEGAYMPRRIRGSWRGGVLG